jgi:hypothetical protein
MRQIAGMLGHTTQRTTELYAKHAPEFLYEAASALDHMFNAPDSALPTLPDEAPLLLPSPA